MTCLKLLIDRSVNSVVVDVDLMLLDKIDESYGVGVEVKKRKEAASHIDRSLHS